MIKTGIAKNFENPSPSLSFYFRAEWKKSNHSMSLFSQYRIFYMEGQNRDTQDAFINRCNKRKNKRENKMMKIELLHRLLSKLILSIIFVTLSNATIGFGFGPANVEKKGLTLEHVLYIVIGPWDLFD